MSRPAAFSMRPSLCPACAGSGFMSISALTPDGVDTVPCGECNATGVLGSGAEDFMKRTATKGRSIDQIIVDDPVPEAPAPPVPFDPTQFSRCPDCDGTGETHEHHPWGDTTAPETVTCGRCLGTGFALTGEAEEKLRRQAPKPIPITEVDSKLLNNKDFASRMRMKRGSR